jgi:hypothetical protein
MRGHHKKLAVEEVPATLPPEVHSEIADTIIAITNLFVKREMHPILSRCVLRVYLYINDEYKKGHRASEVEFKEHVNKFWLEECQSAGLTIKK